jgi:EAL domain-containing protein (putative c-di-GMP-specific phosphodiesterase class I)
MDSTLAAEIAASQVDAPEAPRRRWWRAMLRRSSHVNTPADPRVRRLELHGRRCSSLGLAIAGLTALASLADTWQMHGTAVDAAADAAVRFVDARLDDIDLELESLEVGLGPDAASAGCTASTIAALVRASLDSTLVERFVVAHAGGVPTCHADGATHALPDLPVNQRLALHSTGEIASRLLATRALDGSRVLSAVLDARAFDAGPSAESLWRSAVPMRVTLLSSDARPLRRLEGPQRLARTEAASWGALVRQQGSQRHAVLVRAEVEPASFLTAAAHRLAWALLASALVFGFGLAMYWRWAVRRSRLVIRLEHALAKRQFEPVIQPIVDLSTGLCAGGEVLMRWAHPQRGTLGPGEFIDEAERTGLIVPMSELVMSRAAHRLAPLAAAQPSLYFSINVAPAQLRQPDFAQRLAKWFNADTVPREQVLLELTEREAVDPGGAQALAVLHAQGWRTAIDDFGTGHSSLAALERLPIDRIKIDRAFVSTIGEQTASRPVLDAIIGLARQLNVSLIAEGVETRAQWDYLAARGVRYAQGYLIARPMSIDAFGSWLAAQKALESAEAPSVAASMPSGLAVPVRNASVDALANQLWERMRSTGGLDVRDRIHRLRTYNRCFVGREAVDWLVRHQRTSRAEAVRLGQRLAALGLIRHVLDEHDFKDADLFYRLHAAEASGAQGDAHATDLRQSIRGSDGPRQASRASGLLLHRQCSTGREIVDWIVGRYGVTRLTAVQWGAQLMRTGALRHVFDDQPFRDDASFYRIS